MEIKILGGGCPNCTILFNNVNSACRELNINSNVIKVQDYAEIMNYGVMSTPALVINEKVVGLGKISYKKVRELINNE
ncbi:MAG: thioredoxin family protein [Candidatus Izimaplasma sp.]|nr:thioredoxin family protein [Candidatus Izimaplasma bacterium]